MQIKETIILAGGFGTRLRKTVPDLPECMALVAGQPFLTHVIRYLLSQGIEKFIFSLGYKHEVIEEFLNLNFSTLQLQYSIEEEPLGTGGAIKLACKKSTEKNVLVVNGDTIFKVNIGELATFHFNHHADCTLSLKLMHNFDRYGRVELNEDHSIKCFTEKRFYERGYINGGVYLLNTEKFIAEDLAAKFSFEKDYLERFYGQRFFFGFIESAYFIDIGIPEDYNRAQQELMRPALTLASIDKSWTLFIDRDGVINLEKKGEYILNWREFKFYDGITEAFHQFGNKFGKIIVVSNQRGVGKGLMTEDELTGIHQQMQKQIVQRTSHGESAGSRIDHIYYCTSIDNKHPNRKPNPGMAFLAKKDFPSIDLTKSIMVGNKPSDMQFGRNAGIYTVFVRTTNHDQPFPHPDIDLDFDSLIDFAKAL